MVPTRASPSSSSRTERARAFLVASVLWAGALKPALAEAQESSAAPSEPLVVVTSSTPDAPFVRRLAAELSLFGFRVEVAARPGSDAELGQLLESSGGAALIAVDQGKRVVDVMIAPRAGAAARHERERIDPRRRADTNAAVLAERFRARLTELGIAPVESEESAPEPPPRVTEVAPRSAPLPSEARLWLAGALGTSDGGLGFVPDAQLEIRAFPVPWVSTSAFGRVSLLPARLREPEGESDVRLGSGGVLIDVYPVRGDVVLKGGVGALLVNASMSGSGAAGRMGQSDSVLVPAGLIELGAAYRLSPRVSAELVGFVGMCSPRVGVRFEGRPVAHYGQPFFGIALGAALGVF